MALTILSVTLGTLAALVSFRTEVDIPQESIGARLSDPGPGRSKRCPRESASRARSSPKMGSRQSKPAPCARCGESKAVRLATGQTNREWLTDREGSHGYDIVGGGWPNLFRDGGG